MADCTMYTFNPVVGCQTLGHKARHVDTKMMLIEAPTFNTIAFEVSTVFGVLYTGKLPAFRPVSD